MKIRCGLFSLCAIIFSNQAISDGHHSGFYIGVAGGSSDIESENVSGIDIQSEAEGSGYKAILGYQFNRVFGLEAQYSDYGDVSFGIPVTNMWSPTSASLNANLGYSFDFGLRPYALIGYSILDLNEENTTLSDDQGGAIHAGLGIEYAPESLGGLSLRLGYDADVFVIKTTTVSGGTSITEEVAYSLGMVHAGLSYKF